MSNTLVVGRVLQTKAWQHGFKCVLQFSFGRYLSYMSVEVKMESKEFSNNMGKYSFRGQDAFLSVKRTDFYPEAI